MPRLNSSVVTYRDFKDLGHSHMVAAGSGLEPELHDSESCVLPLDDPAIVIYSQSFLLFSLFQFFYL